MGVGDCVSLLLLCDKCPTIALRPLTPGRGAADPRPLFFPSANVRSGDSADEAIRLLISSLRPHGRGVRSHFCTKPELLNQLLVQVSKSGRSICRFLFRCTLSKNVCCQSFPGLKWLSLESCVTNIDTMHGPETAIAALLIMNETTRGLKADQNDDDVDGDDVTTNQTIASFPKLMEIEVSGQIQDFTVKRFIDPTSGKVDSRRGLISSAGITTDKLIDLYQEFHSHAFPSAFWTFATFSSYAKKIRWTINQKKTPEDSDIRSLYQSLLPYGQLYLTFADFAMGVACMSRSVKHGGCNGHMRMQRTFRFYDTDRSETLSYEQMFAFRLDVMRVNQKTGRGSKVTAGPVTNAERKAVTNHLIHDYKALGMDIRSLRPKDAKPEVTEYQWIRTLTKKPAKGMRGTSGIYRLNFNFFEKRDYAHQKEKSTDSRCPRHQKSQFIPYRHSLVINTKTGIVSRSDIDDHPMGKQTQSESDNAIETACDSAHPVMLCLQMVKQLASQLSRSAGGFTSRTCNDYDNSADWSKKVAPQEQRRRTNIVIQVLTAAKRIFVSQPRIARVTSPVLTFGDTHGNLFDVLLYESLFWSKHPLIPKDSLFLGDYVDRGLQSVEVFLFLLCMKILSPENFFLLRGNHESRCMHQQFTFKDEVFSKFGDRGREVYDQFCGVMDSMPVAGIIDERVFCCHGGVPSFAGSIRSLRKTLSPDMPDVQNNSAVAWEILWNDPVENESLTDMRQFFGSMPSEFTDSHATGFFFNTKRGTGYVFDERAIDGFNHRNGTDHLLRAHELVDNGWKLHFGGKALTVFSSSAYVGEDNTAACLLLQDNCITPMQIQTTVSMSTSVPASDQQQQKEEKKKSK